MKKASVVIPSYNCAPFLALTLKGLSDQTCPAELFEVIVADNNSTDGIEEVTARFSSIYDIRLIRKSFHHGGMGLSATRNGGIKEAENEVIITLDADCIPLPGFIEAHLSHFTGDDSLGVIGIRKFVEYDLCRKFADRNKISRLARLKETLSCSNFGRKRDRRLPELKKFKNHPMPFNCFHSCNASFLREEALSVGGFASVFNGRWGYEDIEFGYRLWKRGIKFIFEPRATVIHQENNLHSFDDRIKGRSVNFEIACKMIPGFYYFRKQLGR